MTWSVSCLTPRSLPDKVALCLLAMDGVRRESVPKAALGSVDLKLPSVNYPYSTDEERVSELMGDLPQDRPPGGGLDPTELGLELLV